jgi:hypothetical protein
MQSSIPSGTHSRQLLLDVCALAGGDVGRLEAARVVIRGAEFRLSWTCTVHCMSFAV